MFRVFVVHGQDESALKSLMQWHERHRAEIKVDLVTLRQLGRLGETIPDELERLAALTDAAIVLVTPDDVGRSKSETRDRVRARQNVWLEVGMFWGRLGRKRTLLLVEDSVEDLPSDISGILRHGYKRSVRKAFDGIGSFLKSLSSSEPDSTTEVIHVTTDPDTRSQENAQVFRSARKSVIITGIGMINFRNDLPRWLQRMSEPESDLTLDIVILDQRVVAEYEDLFSRTYRPNLKTDISEFERVLAESIADNRKLKQHVRFYRFGEMMSFSATVADPSDWGSLMLVETLLPLDRSSFAQRPRLMLRRRCADGLYDRYLRAIDAMRTDRNRVDSA